MADEQNQQHQERTEQPTAKRLRDARRRGQVARSRELTMTIVMLSGSAIVYFAGANLVQSIGGMLRRGLSFDATQIRDGESILEVFLRFVVDAVWALAPLMAVLTVAAIAGGAMIGGWSFSVETIQPKLSKLNPLTGLKRVFGTHGLVEMLKAIGKAGIVSLIGLGVFMAFAPRVLSLGAASLPVALASAGQIIVATLVACSASLLLIALFDVPYQLWSHNRKLRMTRKEVQDELKETEGRPEVKGRIRRMQQELANRRMLDDVPTADVVVTNPTHFSVALRYDDAEHAAPVVVAIGIDHMALRIREIARANEVLVFEAPVLARSLYATSKIGHEIDPRMYVAVAQVLTYVFRLRTARDLGGEWPDRPFLNIDNELERLAGTVAGRERNEEERRH